MPEVDAVSKLLQTYGPMGVSIVLMGSGLIYLLKWLRSEQDRAEAERKESHQKFSEMLDKQNTHHENLTGQLHAQHERTIAASVKDFTDALKENGAALEKQGVRIDTMGNHLNELTDKFDKLDAIQEYLRRKP